VDNKKLRFDGWMLDAESGDLERAGTRTRLPEQPTLVLKELIRHAGHVVTREHLIGVLWPQGVVDFDTGLNTAIRKLRSALGDVAETPRYIETLPRRGYRFIAALDADPDEAAAERSAAMPDPTGAAGTQPSASPEVAAAEPGRRRGTGLLPWLSVGSALLAAAAAALWFTLGTDHAARNPLANVTLTRLTDWSGTEQAAAISRDGKFAAFLADRDGPTDAWVTEIGSGSYRNLTQGRVLDLVNPVIRTLGFSPEGSLVTIWARTSVRERPSDIRVLTVALAGGPLRPFTPQASEVAWSSDARRIAFHTSAPGDPVFVQELPQGTPRRIYVAPAGVHCHFPVWSPDDAFIYFARGVPPDAWDLWRIRPSGSGLEQITFHNSRVSYPVLLSGRLLLYLASDAEGSGPWLYGVDVEKRIPHRLSFGLERYTSLAATADGKRLVATVASPRTSLWSIPLTDGRAADASALHRLTEAGAGYSPRFGHDFLLYVSSQGGGLSVWKLAEGASREIWRREHATFVAGPAISPDGRHIALTVADGARALLYVMQSDGSQARVVTDSLPLRGSPAWTPDGQSIVSAVLESGKPHLATIPLAGGAPLELLSEYSLDPVWSPDGQFLLYSGADIGTTFPLRAASADGRPYGLQTLILTRGARRVVFWRNGQAIIVLRGEVGHKNLSLVELKSGTERQLTELPTDFVIRDFDISPDGTQLVFDRLEESSQIALIERTP